MALPTVFIAKQNISYVTKAKENPYYRVTTQTLQGLWNRKYSIAGDPNGRLTRHKTTTIVQDRFVEALCIRIG